VLRDKDAKSEEAIRAFIDPIYAEAQSLGGRVAIQDTVETSEDDCPTSGVKRTFSEIESDYESQPESQKEEDFSSLFIQPASKKLKGKGRKKKTLRRKRHRRLRTRKVARK
jgi:hypothetical protein